MRKQHGGERTGAAPWTGRIKPHGAGSSRGLGEPIDSCFVRPDGENKAKCIVSGVWGYSGGRKSLSRPASRHPSPPAHQVRSPEAIGTASQDDRPS